MPLFHIHGLMGVLLSSISAGATVICSQGFDASQFIDWLSKLKPTWYSAVPTIHQAVLTKAQQQREKIAHCHLRLIRSSSASLPPLVMEELETIFKVPVIEAYGMTEASHQMASNPLPPQKRKPTSVGIATGIEITILDEEGNQLSAEEIGEVAIKGKNVTQGYVNNPQANESAFTNGWFRTGDNGYLDEDGYLFLKGRIKEIINRGGEKIMPLEVDNVVMELPEVYQAVSFGVSHPTLGEDVVTAVVLKPDCLITASQIRSYLFTKIADYKIPSQVIIVEKIPKGATGKLQRIGLADKLKDKLQPEKTTSNNQTQEQITNIFQQVLQLDSVGINHNFFMLGGDSLKAIQIINLLNQAFDLDLKNTILLKKPTIAQLVTEIAKSLSSSPSLQTTFSQLESNQRYLTSGNINQQELNSDDRNRVLVAPYTPNQEKTIEIWQEALVMDKISIKDSFFELNGDLSTALEMLQLINKEFVIELSLDDLSTHVTIEKLSDLITQKQLENLTPEQLNLLLNQIEEKEKYFDSN